MLGLSEEIRFVGRDGIKEMDPFLLTFRRLAEQQLLVGIQVHAQTPKPSLNPSLKHDFLPFRHQDAEFTRDAFGKAVECFGIQFDICDAGGM